MRTITPGLRGRLLAAAAALSLVASVASCGAVARSDSNAPASPSAAGSASPAASLTPGTPSAPPPSASPSPTPTPGKGPDCAAVRCASVVVTGDMLVHAQLWEQARADALAAGAKGLDFGPMLEGQRKYLEKSDLAVCHLETPVAGPTGPFSAYPSFNVPPQIIPAAQQVG